MTCPRSHSQNSNPRLPNSRCAYALSHFTGKPPAHRRRWSVRNVCLPNCAVQTGSGGRLRLHCGHLQSSLESVAPFRRWPSAQLLGHAHPADMAFCGETLPSGRSTGLRWRLSCFLGGQTWKRSMSQARDVGCHSCCYNSPPSCSRPRRGRDQPCPEGSDREGARISPHFPGEDSGLERFSGSPELPGPEWGGTETQVFLQREAGGRS